MLYSFHVIKIVRMDKDVICHTHVYKQYSYSNLNPSHIFHVFSLADRSRMYN